MKTPQWIDSDLRYARDLAEAGVHGVSSVWNRSGDRPLPPVLRNSVWVAAAIGATVGALSALLGKHRKSGYRVARGSLVGSAIGFGGGVAWVSRDFTGAVARSVIENVNTVRDARWLEKNPIDYA